MEPGKMERALEKPVSKAACELESGGGEKLDVEEEGQVIISSEKTKEAGKPAKDLAGELKSERQEESELKHVMRRRDSWRRQGDVDLGTVHRVVVSAQKLNKAKLVAETAARLARKVDPTRRGKANIEILLEETDRVVSDQIKLRAARKAAGRRVTEARILDADRREKAKYEKQIQVVTSHIALNAWHSSPDESPRELGPLHERRRHGFQQDGEVRIRKLITTGNEAYLLENKHVTDAHDRAKRELKPSPRIRRIDTADPDTYEYIPPPDPDSIVKYVHWPPTDPE